MSEIPRDVMAAAMRALMVPEREMVESVARSLLAERARWKDRDDAVTTVYGRALWHHMDAMRKDDEPRRERAFRLAEDLRAIWPAETQVWEDRYTRPDAQ